MVVVVVGFVLIFFLFFLCLRWLKDTVPQVGCGSCRGDVRLRLPYLGSRHGVSLLHRVIDELHCWFR